MNVILNLEKGKTVITINKDLNKIYDGKAVSLDTKDITVEGSSKTPQLTWWEEVNGTWHKITFAPVNVGNYGVSVDVKEDEFYEEGTLQKVDFKILPKDVVDNKDIVIPDINKNTKIEDIIIKDIDKELEEGKDYDVEIKETENKVEIILTFKGNYTGIITKGYEIAIPETEKKEQPEIKENEFKEKQAVADTGDGSVMGLWTSLAIMSVGMISFIKRKKHHNK